MTKRQEAAQDHVHEAMRTLRDVVNMLVKSEGEDCALYAEKVNFWTADLKFAVCKFRDEMMKAKKNDPALISRGELPPIDGESMARSDSDWK